MHVTWSKILGTVIAIVYATLIIMHEGGITEGAIKCLPALLLPLVLIWFPDELGSMIGYAGRGGNIDVETTPIFISIMGWFFLVGLPVLTYFLI